MTDTTPRAGYDEAVKAIHAGTARPRSLWIIVGDEHQRDAYALKPSPWEGPGEYQHVDFDDGYFRLIRLPDHAPRLSAIAKAAGQQVSA